MIAKSNKNFSIVERAITIVIVIKKGIEVIHKMKERGLRAGSNREKYNIAFVILGKR